MATGKVKWFDNARGFGFIERMDGSIVFVHYSGILTPRTDGFRTLEVGQSVQFDIYEEAKGQIAKNVMVS